MEIIFYSFGKNDNSTKRPTSGGTVFQCNLIEPTSIIAPSISISTAREPYKFNYAYIAKFSRFYFVNDWVYSGGVWVASLSVDVLATYKTEIGNSRQYVVRSSNKSDGTIIDTLYPTTTEVAGGFSTSIVQENPFVSSLANGIFVVGIINGDTGAVGCVSYYAFTSSQFRAFCSRLFNSSDWLTEGIEEIGAELTKAIVNPFQYVASCMWLPVPNIATSGGGAAKFGWWELSVGGSAISGEPRLVSAAFNVPKHPQNARGSYLNCAPFSRYKLVWPCFGQFVLDGNVVGNAERVIAQCFIDPVSGKGTLNIMTDDVTLLTTQVQVGVPIQIAQMATDYLGMATNALSVAGAIGTKDFGAMFSSIGNAIESVVPQLSTFGSNGGIGAFMFPPSLDCEFYKVVDDDNAHRGRPLMQDVVLSTIPGFIVCSDAELEIPGTAAENGAVKAFLNGGFYYE